MIDAGTTNENDIVIGDNGFAEFTDTGRLSLIATTDTDIGGDDDITVGDGDDVVLAGVGSDAIDVDRDTLATIGNDVGDDVVLGDNGEVVFFTGDDNRIVTRIETTAPEDGDRDLIFPANGSDIVLGGAGGDLINAGLDDSRDVVVGDGGVANFTDDGRIKDIATNAPSIGGDDDITVGDGDDIVLGGFGQDAIDVDRETGELIGDDTGDDVVIGDNGMATFFTDGGNEVLVRIETTCLLYTSPSPRDLSTSRMPSSA